MSILIKGMEMPKHCGECGIEWCEKWKRLIIGGMSIAKTRPNDCPLIEICDEDVRTVKWIPVTEKLPEDGQPVLVCTIHHYIYVWTYNNSGYGEYWWEDEEGYYCDNEDATHWMPLPDLPKDGET